MHCFATGREKTSRQKGKGQQNMIKKLSAHSKPVLFCFVQAMVIFYSLLSVLSKVASNYMKTGGLFSFGFLATVFAMFAGLGIYAILWQKVLKRVDLTVAYANKGVGLFWSLFWSVLLFHETVRWNNIAGIIIIVAGIIMVTKNVE